MNSTDVVGVMSSGISVCPDCYTDEEQQVADDTLQRDEISPIFMDEALDAEFTCSRCGDHLVG